MNFKEHYQILNEGILSHEYKISIFFPKHRFENIKYGRPEEVWRREIKNIKQDTIFRTNNILNNILFDGKRGVISDKRMSLHVDMDTLNDALSRVVIYIVGVKVPNLTELQSSIYRTLNLSKDVVSNVKITPSHVMLKQHLGKELKGKSKEEVEQTLDTLKKI